MTTKQENFWDGNFGRKYTDRNNWNSDEDWDKLYLETWGLTKIDINKRVLEGMQRDIKILEVGCNNGAQLRGLQRMGFSNLYGVELQSYAVEKSKQKFSGLNIITGSGFDLPFKDGFFDLVCTNGVLIHISPSDHFSFMKEIYRCSKKYIMGWEYYDKETKEINYRGNKGFMWKADYSGIYKNNFPGLELRVEHFVKYVEDDNKNSIFLLEKK